MFREMKYHRSPCLPRLLAGALLALLLGVSPRLAAAAEAAPVANGTTSDAAFHFVVAKMLASEGEYLAAVRAFETALEAAPDDPFLRLEYASHLADMGSAVRGERRLEFLRRAAEQAEQARRQTGDDVDVWRTLAEIHLALAREQPASLADARQAMERVVAAEPDDLETALTLGQIHLNQGRAADAAELFARVAEHTPGNRYVDSLFGEALMRAGRRPEAEEVLGRLLDGNPASQQVRLALAGLRSERGDHAAALELLEEAPPEVRSDAEVERRIALELVALGRSREALALIGGLTEEAPEDVETRSLQALALAAEGRTADLDAVVDAIPATDPRLGNLVATLERRGQVDAAERVLRRTLDRLGREDGAQAADAERAWRSELAALLSRRGDPAAAADLLRPLTRSDDGGTRRRATLAYADFLSQAERPDAALEALDRLGEDPVVLAVTAEVLFTAGRDERADEVIERLAAGDGRSVLLAARAAQAQGRFADSIALLEPLAAADDAPADVLFALASAYERTGRLAESEALFQRLLERAPDFHPALNYLGYMWAEEGKNLDRALKLVRRAVALEPDQGAYVDSLGWVHFQRGEDGLALRYLQRAVVLSPDEAEIQEHLGDVLARRGEVAAARNAYRRALDLVREADDADVADDPLQGSGAVTRPLEETPEVAELRRKLDELEP